MLKMPPTPPLQSTQYTSIPTPAVSAKATTAYVPELHGAGAALIPNLGGGAVELLADFPGDVGPMQRHIHLASSRQYTLGWCDRASLVFPRIPGLSRRSLLLWVTQDQELFCAAVADDVTVNGEKIDMPVQLDLLDVVSIGALRLTVQRFVPPKSGWLKKLTR